MNSKSIVWWMLIAVLLTGCSASAEIGGNVSVIPSETVSMATTAVPFTMTALQGTASPTLTPSLTATMTRTPTATLWSTEPHSLQIEVMRQQSYPGSEITFEQTLSTGANYSRYVVSYLSEGNKIYALMTIPNGTKPETGWPVIVFNHGYIAPDEYRTTERYVAYVDMIARNGYIVFKSDYRGCGDSEGEDVIGGGYGTPGYTVDILNAVASLQAYEDADPDRIGMWGHSMGGQITLRAMVVSKDIKAGVIWGGVVAPYPDIIERWDFRAHDNDNDNDGNLIDVAREVVHSVVSSSARNWIRDYSSWVEEFSNKYGTVEQNPVFWATISPNSYLDDLSGPIQLHHSTTDEMVPVAWSEILAGELQAVNKQPYEFYTYEGDNHNISANFGVAMQSTVDFFDKYVKGE